MLTLAGAAGGGGITTTTGGASLPPQAPSANKPVSKPNSKATRVSRSRVKGCMGCLSGAVGDWG